MDLNNPNIPDLSTVTGPKLRITVQSQTDGTTRVFEADALVMGTARMTGPTSNPSADVRPVIVGAEMPVRVALMGLLKRIEAQSPPTLNSALEQYRTFGDVIPDNGEDPAV